MRVLCLSNCPLDPALGSGKAVLRYVEGLRNLGAHVDVYEPAQFELRGTIRGRPYRQAAGAWLLAGRGRLASAYDVVEFYGSEFWSVATMLRRRASRPLLVAHTNGFEPQALRRSAEYAPPASAIARASEGLQKALAKWFFRNTDGLVCMSTEDADAALRMGYYPSSRVAVIEHGVDEVFFADLPIGGRRPRVAFVGTWIARKGVGVLATAMTRAMTQDRSLHLDLVGTGTPADVVLGHFPDGLRSRITVHGRLTERQVADVLQSARVFVFPSRYEGFGLAIAEAMASGCAVVTTRTGFAVGLSNELEAVLCEFDDPDAICAAVIGLVSSEPRRRSMALRGHQRARRLSWDAASRSLHATYERWLEAHRSRSR